MSFGQSDGFCGMVMRIPGQDSGIRCGGIFVRNLLRVSLSACTCPFYLLGPVWMILGSRTRAGMKELVRTDVSMLLHPCTVFSPFTCIFVRHVLLTGYAT